MTSDGTPGRLDAAEIERFELAVEREIVEATKRGLTAFDLAMILADYAADLERMDRVPAGWSDS